MSLVCANDRWSYEGATLFYIMVLERATLVECSWEGAVNEWWSCKEWAWQEGFCNEQSCNGLSFTTDLGVFFLRLCGCTGFSVCSGLPKMTFLVVDMVSKAECVEASLGTLISIIPSLSDAA